MNKIGYIIALALFIIVVFAIRHVRSGNGHPLGSAAALPSSESKVQREPDPESLVDSARRTYYRKRLSSVPIGIAHDSLIVKMLKLRLVDGIQKYYPSATLTVAHATNGRIDSLCFNAHDWTVMHETDHLLPEEIGDLTEIKYLIIDNVSDVNALTLLGRLTKLEYLDISRCGITSLPNELETLQHLESLNLEYNHLSSIPSFVYKLGSLKTLNISNNEISKVESGIKSLTHLSTLIMDQNQIKYLPREITTLNNLDSVTLSENFLFDENLDSTVVAWLNKRFFSWRKRTTDRDLTGFIRDLGRLLLHKYSIFNVELGDQDFTRDNTSPETIDFIKIPPKNVIEMLAKADSQSLAKAIRKISRLDSNQVPPREMIRGLLSTHVFLNQHPEIQDIIAYEIGKWVSCLKKSDGYGCDEVPHPEYPEYFETINRNLFNYTEANRIFLLFWGERQRDKSINETVTLLNRIREYCFPMLSLDSVNLFTTPTPKPIKTFYFSDRTFGDPENEAFHPGFAYNEELLLHYLKDVYPKKCAQDWHIVKDSHLWHNLVSLHTPYFDST